MRSSGPLGALALLSASAVVLAEEYNNNMPCFNDICWTSWKCSYSRHSKYDGTIGKRCGLPDSVYTPENDGAQGYTLVWEEKYLMEWTSNFASQNEDIVLEWLIYEAPGTETPILFNETDLYPDYTGKGPEKFVVAHSQIIGHNTIGWYFQPQMSFFPNEHLNVSAAGAAGYAMERNVFRLYHPKTFDPKNATTYDVSVPFHVMRHWEQGMINKAVENKGSADNKKLAIGVCLGVVFSGTVAFMVSWYTSAWFNRRRLAKTGPLLVSEKKAWADEY